MNRYNIPKDVRPLKNLDTLYLGSVVQSLKSLTTIMSLLA